MPKSTEVNTLWAVRNFQEWMDSNSCHPEQPCCEGALLTNSLSKLSFWLQKYVLGTREKTGEKYPAKSVHLLYCGINHYMKEKKLNAFNILDCESSDFKLLFNANDSYFRELHGDGIGSDSKGTEPVTRDAEDKLWSTGVLSVSMPKQLLNTVFFLNRRKFSLQDGNGHCCLKISQIVHNISPEGKVHYTNTENCSNNRAGGFDQLSVLNKVVISTKI